MDKPVRIALDAMGGDFGPSVVAPGAEMFLERQPNVKFLMFGDREKVMPFLDARPRLADATIFRHTDVSVGMADKPSQALRAGRRTFLDVAGDRSRQEGRGRLRGFRRQYRRPDGHVEDLPAHHGE